MMDNEEIIKTLLEIKSDISDSMCQYIRSNDDYTPESDLKKIEALVLSVTILERMGRY
jgi:hypothetical protein